MLTFSSVVIGGADMPVRHFSLHKWEDGMLWHEDICASANGTRYASGSIKNGTPLLPTNAGGP